MNGQTCIQTSSEAQLTKHTRSELCLISLVLGYWKQAWPPKHCSICASCFSENIMRNFPLCTRNPDLANFGKFSSEDTYQLTLRLRLLSSFHNVALMTRNKIRDVLWLDWLRKKLAPNDFCWFMVIDVTRWLFWLLPLRKGSGDLGTIRLVHCFVSRVSRPV